MKTRQCQVGLPVPGPCPAVRRPGCLREKQGADPPPASDLRLGCLSSGGWWWWWLGANSLVIPTPPPLPTATQRGPSPALPAIQSSPRRRMWGQCCSILIKKGFVTPRSTLGLSGASRGVRKGLLPRKPLQAPWAEGHSRALRPRRVLFELAVVNSEVWAEVAAVLQGRKAAGGGG